MLFGACTSHTYLGIPLSAGLADPGLQQLAARAQSGDKQAQLALGIAFEEGRGVTPNRSRAIFLYRHAAKDSPSTLWVYAPSPGGGAPARVLPFDKPFSPGLPEARLRLDRMTNAPH